ncbi:MAG: amidohydrolase family protein [Gammaproteobacteria bacterium]
MVIDGDGHIVEPLSLWKQYIPRSCQDRIYVQFGEDGLGERLVVGNVIWHLVIDRPGLGTGDFITPGGLKPGRPAARRWEQGEHGGFDAHARLALHDAEGIDAAVLFPTHGMDFTNTVTDPDLARVAAEAVNRWAADFCSAAPDELYAVVCVTTTDPQAGADELRRCVREYGSKAGFVRSTPTADGRWLDHPSMTPIWQAAVELDVPITVHNNTTPLARWAGQDRASSFLLAHSVAHPFEAMLAFGALLQGRVFERFPTLRIGFMESGCGWAPFWMERLHEHAEMMGWMFDPPLGVDPSEVFRERCVVGTESEEREVRHVQEMFGEETVLWASDFPHFDTESPFVLPRSDLTDSQRDGMYRRTALKFYRLDESAIVRSKVRRRSETPA